MSAANVPRVGSGTGGATAARGLGSAKRGPSSLLLAAAVLAFSFGGAPLASAQAIKVGSFTKVTGGAPVAQVVPHGLGMAPKALILWTDGKTNEAFSADFLYALGMTDGATSFSLAAASRNAVTPNQVWRRLANKALAIWSPGAVALAEADLQSWDTTSFTLNWTTNDATACVVHFIAIGGGAVSARVLNWTMATGPGNRSVTGVGFSPDVVLHAYPGPGFTAAPPSGAAGAHFGLGVMDKNGGQWAIDEESYNDLSTAFTTRGQQTNACIYAFNNTRVVQKAASFVSMDPDGFTVNFTTANTNASQVVSLALQGVAAKAGSFLKSTTVPPAAAYVQSRSQNYGTAVSAAITLPAASTTGNVVVVSLDYANRSAVVSTVTDNKGNTYRRVFGPTDWGSGTDRMYTYYAKNVTGGGAAITITITLSGGNSGGFWEVYATEFRGVDTADPLDQASETLGNSNPLSSSPVTTTSPDEVLYAFCDCDAGALTPNAPFTGRENLNGNFSADRSVTSIGSYNVTGTNVSSVNWNCHLLSFRHFGTAQAIAGVGFSPDAVLLASFQDVAQASPVAQTRLGVGAVDRYFNQGSSALADLDLANPTSVQGIDKTSRAFMKVNNSASTINAEAVLYSMDASGFRLDWTTNDAVATEILYLALAAPRPSSYARFRTITVPALSGSCTASLTSYPMLVDLTNDLELRRVADGGYVQDADFYDITFSDLSNNRLDYEIEQYTSAPGGANLVAWVRVPTLSVLGSTTIVMRYGNASVTSSAANPAGVWDSSYKAVWHLKETGTGAAGEYLDSTFNANNGRGGGGTVAAVPTRVAGQLGFGQSFDGTNDYIDAGANAVLNITGPLTLEAWFQLRIPRAGADNGAPMVGKGSSPQYWLYHDFDADYRATFNVNTPTSPYPSATGLTASAWHFGVGVYTVTSSAIYADGALAQTLADSSPITGEPAGRVKIGAGDNSPYFFNGPLDEVRISSTARSSCWIETEYKNESSPGTFYTLGTATAVELTSFTAAGVASGVELSWQTASELSNLGFHLHRSMTEAGPYERITTSLIPGLGSSPVGATYSYLDVGLVPGQLYYYKLEDIDTKSVSTFHGPVSVVAGVTVPSPVPVPSPPSGGGAGGGGGDGTEPGGGESVPGSCPSWVLAAAPDAVSPVCTRHGDPDSVSLQLLSRDASTATLELHTSGFWALRDASETVRVFVPGLEFPSDPKAPALPLRRALVDAVVGKGVELVSAQAYEAQSFRGLRPSAVGASELAVRRDGTVLPARRSLAAPLLTRGYLPREVAHLAGTVFQGERKSAVVEITPVRFSGSGLVLARRVRVKLAFTGEVEGEIGTGSRGRLAPRRRALFPDALARLYTSERGLHAVGFEALFPGRPRGFSMRFLRLQRQGEAVAFHVEPEGPVFGPGSVLYFYADRTAGSTDYSSEVAYELVRSRVGSAMSSGAATPVGASVGSSSTGFASFETNRIYQPGLLEAEDVWLWQAAISTAAAPPPVAFSLGGVAAASGEAARLVVHLQGGSESGVVADHHVRVLVNGVEVGEATFAGKKPYRLEAAVPASLLKEGMNELSLVNVGDTGVYSLVFLDRFEVSYLQASLLRGGVFEGVWTEGGMVEVGDVTGPAVLLRDPAQPGPEGSAVTWLTGFEASGSSVRFQADAGHRYLVVSREGLLRPRIGRIPYSTLREASNKADYLVIGPRELLEAAAPLLERRRSQGLVSRAVSFEEVVSEFGHGQASAEAIRAFLSYAYHSWRRPSPRYVLLLGDATSDPRQFLSTSWPSPLPALWEKTSYLWTVSDPALAAVNGEDELPDLAIGRLPARSREEAERLVSKVLAWEETGQGLGGNAVLVADTPDQGGDFEADVEDVRSSFLSDRATTTLRVRELGSEARPAILGAFDEGASLMSYVGHGGTAVWSSANVLNTWDAPSLLAQSRQPVLLTLNCLNGYFVAPNFDALPEALLKAEGRGVVGAFSPSGLSLDGPAHEYHRALMAQLVSGEHTRLGDAILAAQRTYAETGLMPELLTVYHLLGDPATRIR